MGYFETASSTEKVRCKTIEEHRGKYARNPKMEDGRLDVWFGKLTRHDDPDVCVRSGEGAGGSPTRGFVLDFFCGPHEAVGKPGWTSKTFLEEMDARGFDISTLKFTIRKKK